MEYISHEDYKKMLGSFGKEVPKKALNEMHTMEKQDGPKEFHKMPADIEEDLEKEGNAFTAGLAKTKKGGEFKVGNKSFKDRTNYDASIKEGSENVDIVFSKYNSPLLKALVLRAGNKEDVDAHNAVDRILRTIAKELGLKSDYPYMEDEMFSGNYSPKEAVAYAKEMFASELEDGKLDEYQFDQMYPDDPGPFEGLDAKLKEFLAKEDDTNWEAIDNDEAEENETDNGIEEDVNLPSSQATGPSIEETRRPLSHLSPEERDQLRQYVETIKTVKEQINKMVNKPGMEEGGDMTGLVMRPATNRYGR